MIARFSGLWVVALCGCSEIPSAHQPDIDVDQTFTRAMSAESLAAALPSAEQFRVEAVCGPAEGRGLYEDDGFSRFQTDGITDGRLILYSDVDGANPNVTFRDAGGTFINAIEDGADVRILDEERRVWVVAYPSTGVVETHNLIVHDRQLIDIWTTNKPALSAWGPSARIFTSYCFRH